MISRRKGNNGDFSALKELQYTLIFLTDDGKYQIFYNMLFPYLHLKSNVTVLGLFCPPPPQFISLIDRNIASICVQSEILKCVYVVG